MHPSSETFTYKRHPSHNIASLTYDQELLKTITHIDQFLHSPKDTEQGEARKINETTVITNDFPCIKEEPEDKGDEVL